MLTVALSTRRPTLVGGRMALAACMALTLLSVLGCEPDRLYRSELPPDAEPPEPGAPPSEPPPPIEEICTDVRRQIVLQPEFRGVDFFFYIDRSGSMATRVEEDGETRYSVAVRTLESLIMSFDGVTEVAIQPFPYIADAPPDVKAVEVLPGEAEGICGECNLPTCAFERCTVDSDCAAGMCRGTYCLCGNVVQCNPGFVCTKRYCDGGPLILDLEDILLNGSLEGYVAACLEPNQCRLLRGDPLAQCVSFNAIFRDNRPAPPITDAHCDAENYVVPQFGFGPRGDDLTAAIAELQQRGTTGSTPLGAAITGARPFVEAHQLDSSDRRVVQVLMTDGAPTQCDANFGVDGIADTLREMATGLWAIPDVRRGHF